MDSASRQLIQQMLAEDELHHNFARQQALEDEELDISNDYDQDADSDDYTVKKEVKRKVSGKSKVTPQQGDVTTSVKVDSATHGSRWTEEEDTQLLEGIKRYGHGKWKEVSQFIGTRSPLQVKNRARHLFVHRGIELPRTSVDIVDKSEVELAPQAVTMVRTPTTDTQQQHTSPSLSVAINKHNDSDIDVDEEELEKVEERMANTEIDIKQDMEMDKDKDNKEEEQPTSEPLPVSSSNTEDNEAVVLPSDTMIIDRNAISEEEVRGNPEFFCGKPACTPERYMKIRNHILDCWDRIRPAYLTKTGARKQLRDCGDVNVIGRVHSYLEQVGAINVNCDFAIKRKPAPRQRTIHSSEYGYGNNNDDDDDYQSGTRPTAFNVFNDIVAGSRRRRVRDEYGEWQDERDLEGRVIEHGSLSEEALRVVSGARKRTRTTNKIRDFTNKTTPPFSVHIVPSAMTVMDLHAHLLRTEVIGLLGGKFDATTNQIDILTAFPCRGASTDFQFAERGLAVVGWYHSHPTFEPTPSIRDIENQVNYQTLFRHDSGQEPFVGVIVNPYDRDRLANQSKMRFFMAGPEYAVSAHYRVPYRLVETEQAECLDDSQIDQLAKQVDKLMDDFGEHTQ
ncbi:hypothetical protein BDF22DRAFT_691578 [Syncephalis plumigaleata]|nr:hypothetical protein BDF22DRAFT_691578 [Syncephalis plumigaleata]